MDRGRLFEKAPDAILLIGPDGRYLDANHAACALTEYSREELVEMRIGALSAPDQQAHAQETFDRLREGRAVGFSYGIVTKNGARRHVSVFALPLGGGAFQVALRPVDSVTPGWEESLHSPEAYRALADLCQAAVIVAGGDGRIRSWNRGAVELFGYAAEEAVGEPVTMLIPKRHQARHRVTFARHLKPGEQPPFARTLSAEGLHRSGAEIPIEVSVGVGWTFGEPVFTAVVRDVTEQRRVLEQLNDALQRLQFHVDRMPLAYIAWDTDFRVVDWNPAAERMFGYDKAEALGLRAYDLILPPEARTVVDRVWSDLLLGDTSSHAINANVRKDGTRLTCEWFNTALHDSAGNISGVASMAMDVSERDLLESRIRDAQKLESLGVLAAGIAHDFNSSLMVILGNAALLRSVNGLPPRAAEYIELIEQAGARADVLIKHLLAYARTGRHNPQPTDLNAVIHDTLKLLRSALDPRHELSLNLGSQLPTILADRSQVEQVLLNLCLNAREAMPRGGAISLSTRGVKLTQADTSRCVPYDVKPGRYVEVTVGDTGCGMSGATVSRMFDPFFTTKAEGHGLGMASVLGILRQHRAAIRVDSRFGAGTEMHVYFPVAAREDDRSSRTSGPSPLPGKRRRGSDRS